MSTDYSLKTFARGAVYISANHPFDVHSITKAIGIEPTYVWYPKKERQPPFSQMCWGFELPPQDYGTIDIPVNEILDIFLPLRDRIIPFVRQHRLEPCVDVLIHMYESNIGCHLYCGLEPATLKRLAEFEVSFQITHRFHYDDDVSIND